MSKFKFKQLYKYGFYIIVVLLLFFLTPRIIDWLQTYNKVALPNGISLEKSDEVISRQKIELDEEIQKHLNSNGTIEELLLVLPNDVPKLKKQILFIKSSNLIRLEEAEKLKSRFENYSELGGQQQDELLRSVMSFITGEESEIDFGNRAKEVYTQSLLVQKDRDIELKDEQIAELTQEIEKFKELYFASEKLNDEILANFEQAQRQIISLKSERNSLLEQKSSSEALNNTQLKRIEELELEIASLNQNKSDIESQMTNTSPITLLDIKFSPENSKAKKSGVYKMKKKNKLLLSFRPVSSNVSKRKDEFTDVLKLVVILPMEANLNTEMAILF